MRPLSLVLVAALLIPAAVSAKPPREESPAPKELVSRAGLGNSDAEIERGIAAAAAHPLGSLANPVRVGGPQGGNAYLASLRCGDGSEPAIGTRRKGGTGAFGSVVELYTLDCGAAAPGRQDLALDLYPEGHVERSAPAGFRIVAP